MIGHSKWANIRHKKTVADAKRGGIWMRLIKEITVAAHPGGGDADPDPHLCLAIDKTTDANMPKDNISRVIQRGAGGLEGANHEKIYYEGYDINGAAVIIDCLTGSCTHIAAEVRHGFDKYGGNVGVLGSVAFLFSHIDQFISAPGTPEDKLIDAVLRASTGDVIMHGDGLSEITCPPHDFAKVKTALEAAGFKAELAEVIMKPQTEVVFTNEDAIRMQKLLDVLENLDDVQEVFTNVIIGE